MSKLFVENTFIVFNRETGRSIMDSREVMVIMVPANMTVIR